MKICIKTGKQSPVESLVNKQKPTHLHVFEAHRKIIVRQLTHIDIKQFVCRKSSPNSAKILDTVATSSTTTIRVPLQLNKDLIYHFPFSSDQKPNNYSTFTGIRKNFHGRQCQSSEEAVEHSTWRFLLPQLRSEINTSRTGSSKWKSAFSSI